MVSIVRAAMLALLLATAANAAFAQAPVAYRLSFPDRVHRLMDVDVTFADLPAGPLQLRISRTSPGRYALHEFAKNVFDVRITDLQDRPLTVSRPNLHQWDVAPHPGAVRVRYRVYGDRVDGTYLGVDDTHAHINMPSALIWARGLEMRPATVRFEAPAGSNWRVATQLFPGTEPGTFTAPNLPYLMDSPSEFSDHAIRTFQPSGSSGPTFRLAVHHTGTDADLDALTRDVQRMVIEARQVFGEYPAYENDTYTFIVDYLPWANGDAMEHRNSTFLTSSSSIAAARSGLLDSIAHEFFHAWNVERIRPRSLEPFNFEEANVSSELWLGEGVTNYYGPLILRRSGLISVDDFIAEMEGAINTVIARPGRSLRTVEEMSQLAPFVDAATSIDRTSTDNTFISYYTWGSVIGIGLDLTLRAESDNAITLDQLMRALWARHGKAPGAPGIVSRPYTAEDVKAALGEVWGSRAKAEAFFSRFIQGHDVVDFAPLLERAGFVVRPLAAGRGWLGDLRLQAADDGVRVVAAAPFGSPAFAAGVDRDDVLMRVAGVSVAGPADVATALEGRRPGDRVAVELVRRGRRITTEVTLAEDPRVRILPAERAGAAVSDAQRRFRDAWLSSQQ